jgi:hypothetical protein
MARIHSPQQRVSDSRWDYTISSDEERWVHPTGYCAGWRSPEESEETLKKYFGNDYTIPAEERERTLRHKDKFHSDGHATAEEAVECHRQYELDFETRSHHYENVQHKCQECGDWTHTEMSVGQFFRWWLCVKHQGRDILEKLLKARDKA